jgi:hypothetical protein
VIRPERAALVLLPLLLAALATGCVGPAPDTATYAGKAGQTAKAALSAVETGRQAVETATAGRMTQPYLETVLSGAEDDLSSVQQTFDSIQPPDDPAADRLRGQLDGILSDGADGLAQLRILARRDEPAQLAATARQLGSVASDLRRFSAEHPS